jgi:hypothetical protein
VCPRCGRTYDDPSAIVCRECHVALVPGGLARPTGDHSELKVRVAPVIAEALASAQAGEDFDEALLRALKARYPDQAAALLSAFSRIIELDAQHASEDKQQALRRLAQSEPGPEVVLRTSGGARPTTVTETRRIRIGDQEYGSLEEVPPRLRRMIEKGMRGERTRPKAGCAGSLVAGWLIALLRLAGT